MQNLFAALVRAIKEVPAMQILWSAHAQRSNDASRPAEDRYVPTGPLLGRGYSAEVYQDGNRAVKCIKKVRDDLLGYSYEQGYEKEVSILQKINHPNIIKLHANWDDDTTAYLALDLCTGGELFYGFQAFTVVETFSCAVSIFGAVSYLHEHGICHGDIKLENIMCTTTGPIGDYKIVDFGEAFEFTPGKSEKQTGVPTGTHLPPEALSPHEDYDHTIDLWALGVMMFIMLSGGLPFQEGTNSNCAPGAVLAAAKNRTLPDKNTPERNLSLKMLEPLRQKKIPEAGVSLICGLLDIVPSARSTASDCVAAIENLQVDLLVQQGSDVPESPVADPTNLDAKADSDDHNVLTLVSEALVEPSSSISEVRALASKFKVGDRVEVKASVKEPQFGWGDEEGTVKHGQVGVITKIDEEGMLDIDFEHVDEWGAHPADMQLAGAT